MIHKLIVDFKGTYINPYKSRRKGDRKTYATCICNLIGNIEWWSIRAWYFWGHRYSNRAPELHCIEKSQYILLEASKCFSTIWRTCKYCHPLSTRIRTTCWSTMKHIVPIGVADVIWNPRREKNRIYLRVFFIHIEGIKLISNKW